MIAISHTLQGNFARFGPQIRAALREIVEAHLADFQADVRQSFEDTKSGRTYRRDDGGLYTASAPGEAPAVNTRELWLSIETAMLDDTSGLAWTDLERAEWLNYGVPGELEARPFWEPALDDRRAKFLADLADLESRLM